MIRKKRLQVLIHALQIVYVFGENGLIDTGQYETANDPTEFLSFDYRTDLGANTDSYLETVTASEKFQGETTEFEQNDNTSIIDSPNETTNNETLICKETDSIDVRNLTIDLVGTEWILLSWQPPCVNATDKSFVYSIDVCLAESCLAKIIENETRYNVTDLDPCVEYNFVVKVIEEDTKSDGASVAGETSSNISGIGDVRELVAHTTTNTITLRWKPPINYTKCIHNYAIIRCFKNVCDKTMVIHEEHTATDLEPCEQYFFTVRAMSYSVESDGFNITLKTNSPKSSKPQHPIVEANAFSLFIHWQPPEVGAKCVDHYCVTISPQSTTKQTSETNITIGDLYACTPYVIYINAVDEDNNDGERDTMQARTAATVSTPPLLHTKEPIVTATEITLSWKIEKGSSNCTVTSLKAVCNSTGTNGHGYEVTNGQTEVPINSSIQDEFLIVNSVIRNVSPFTTYICWSYVVNQAGNSELSNLISVTTLEDSK